MKFLIHSHAYTASAPKDGLIPLKGLENRRALFMKETASCLLNSTDEWLSFEAYTTGMDTERKRDLRDALTLLSCFDLAEIDEEETAVSPCRVAGERDYRPLAAFIGENLRDEWSILPSKNPAYYNEDALRFRQFNNHEYNFLLEEGGELLACMNVAVPGTEQLSNAAFFQSVVFSKKLDEQGRSEAFRLLVDYIAAQFRGDLNKFRFALSSGDPNRLMALLPSMGFAETAVLKDEFADGVDLILYDRMIEA